VGKKKIHHTGTSKASYPAVLSLWEGKGVGEEKKRKDVELRRQNNVRENVGPCWGFSLPGKRKYLNKWGGGGGQRRRF